VQSITVNGTRSSSAGAASGSGQGAVQAGSGSNQGGDSTSGGSASSGGPTCLPNCGFNHSTFDGGQAGSSANLEAGDALFFFGGTAGSSNPANADFNLFQNQSAHSRVNAPFLNVNLNNTPKPGSSPSNPAGTAWGSSNNGFQQASFNQQQIPNVFPVANNGQAQPTSSGNGGNAQPNSLLQCLASCAADQYGLTSLLVRGGVGLAATPIPKSLIGVPTLPGSSKFTNPLSYIGFLNPSLDVRLPVRILGTTRLFGIAGRAVPFIGEGLLLYDAASIGICTIGCNNFSSPPSQ
jgi:hypothetical protein